MLNKTQLISFKEFNRNISQAMDSLSNLKRITELTSLFWLLKSPLNSGKIKSLQIVGVFG